MNQSSTFDIGLDVHQESIAVACIAQEHGAEVTSLGTIGIRQGDIDHLIRKMPKASIWSLSMKPDPVGADSIAISRKKDLSAGSLPPHSCPKKRATA